MTQPEIAQVPRVTHLFFLLLLFMCAAFFFWAYKGTLDIVSMAKGEVVPSGKIKHVQHFEGGIIREIKVKEGEKIVVDQPLVELEQVRSGASLEELKMRIDALEVDCFRFTAQLQKNEQIFFPKPILKDLPLLVKEANALFDAQKKSHQSTINRLRTIIHQKEQRIKTIQSQLGNTLEQLPLLEEELELSQDLLKDNLTTRMKHIAILKNKKKVKGKILNHRSSLQEARHDLNEAKEELNETKNQFNQETRENLKQAKQKLKELSVRVKKFEDNLQRTIIRSPINGVVKRLYLNTKGGVVKPGDTIADIVPSEERLIIEAHLNISDIGYIRENQKVFLQLPSKDARKFQKLKGKVVSISPDTFSDARGRTFYNVRIESEQNFFQGKENRYRLYPGMILHAYIHIGKRTVLEYLIDPFVNTLSFSMQER